MTVGRGVAAAGTAVEPAAPARRRRRSAGARLLSRIGPLTLTLLLLVVVAAVAGPAFSPYDYDDQELARILRPPAWSENGSWATPLGTDGLGRDLLTRVFVGLRVSLAISGTATLGAAVIGVGLGLVAGYRRGWIDDLVMRVAEVQLAFPYLLLGIAVLAVVQPSIGALIGVLMLRSWVVYAKVVRAATLSLRERDFVEAARAVGARGPRVIVRHLLPNLVATILVISSFQVAELIIVESSLSFLGLGIPPPLPSLGSLLREGRDYLETAWWAGTMPGLMIVAAVLGVNALGDAIRDVLDPHYHER